MCGIAGFIAETAGSPSGATLSAMTDSISHRGPDDSGFYCAQTRNRAWTVGLGHRRLSIIDIGGGHQPMSIEDGALTIVFNGEIYNYQSLREQLRREGYEFGSGSDTEVLLNAYRHFGLDCVNHLRGMFAFALWDARRERLLLARDRFGKKPLFIHCREGLLAFGSEIKALLQKGLVDPEVDFGVIQSYLLYRYVPGPSTLYRGVKKLSPGSIGIWERGEWQVRSYYRPPDRSLLPKAMSGTGIVESFERCLDESVQLRMISDVPFGAFLSGGLDSSTVVALMSRHSEHPIRTFSVGFRETDYSELDHANTIARRFRTDHHELFVTDRELIDNLPSLVRYRDGPVCEPSDIPIYLLAREASKSVKMVLTGEGSDELLGGYPKYRVERWSRVFECVPRSLRCLAARWVERGLPYGQRRIKIAASAIAASGRRERLVRWFGGLDACALNELIEWNPKSIDPWVGDQFDIESGLSPLRGAMYFDQRSWLPDNLLERGDRMTMAASIEARMPFMDHVLADYVSRLPDSYRIQGGVTKWILREVASKLIPSEILRRPKVGFRVPVNQWFRSQLRGALADALLGPSSLTRAYYRPGAVQRLLNDHVSGRHNHEKVLWTLWNLEIWHRECL